MILMTGEVFITKRYQVSVSNNQ